MRQEITSVGEDVERREHSCTAGRNVNLYSLYESNMEVPQKINSNSCFGYLAKKCETSYHKDTGTHMVTVALFTTARTWKRPECPFMDD